ncbi:MAG: PQQ-binding-like beta-propeller repeat protein [Ferruginibacter sp.]
MKIKLAWLYCCLIAFSSCTNNEKANAYAGWEVYGGTKEGTRYSSLTQIDTNNVAQLTEAWRYHTGDADTAHHSQIQCNPIIVDSILYGCTPMQKIFAADAATGKQQWVFDPFDSAVSNTSFFVMNNTRGITCWKGEKEKRLFFTAGSYLHALDAATGKLIKSFGDSGKIDLHEGLGRDVKNLFITYTSPGIVYKDFIIVGSRVDEGPNAAPGHIRAYNVHTGKQEWIFHTIPHPGEAGYETWDDPNAWKHIGGANCWSGFTLDEKKGILFVPTGSASYDFYGGMRKGDNLFADCLLALDAATGKRIWHFQNIHHDVWDKDLPTPPALVTVTRDGKKVEAVAQPTKTGYIYLFERTTGKPLFPIREVAVPTNTDLIGEKLSPTQPRPLLPPPFVREVFNEKDINDLVSLEEQDSLKKKLAGLNNGFFKSPSKKGTVIFPGYDGGAEWGGPAFDMETGLLYVNANEMPWILQLKDVDNKTPRHENWQQAGKRLYTSVCMSCHGADRGGSGNYPALLNVSAKYSVEQFDQLIQTGRRMMPAFKHLSQEERNALASFVLENKKEQLKKFSQAVVADSFLNLPYNGTGYNKFLTKDGWPAVRPPWGTLNAINLNTGNIEWKIPLGETKFLKEKGIITGTENYGGPVVTAGGLVFIAATSDSKIRAFNKRTGKLLWEANLPASGFATPAIYAINGKQFVVIACGGGKLKTLSGDTYVAFALNSKPE